MSTVLRSLFVGNVMKASLVLVLFKRSLPVYIDL